ncbi:ATP-binding protein [Puia dinghuensis]|uniref:Oxygen sensor histidine kinase NreB n=1 Tax=Puia dinghuensis TaxID=1792502 RepID=A0A8J2UHE4_9BACT|nr:sensor histidine kinase [Puia dinghuensis]GGB17177.1 hypothetical protein GCM10011511_46200 [Puia dinghuensis]
MSYQSRITFVVCLGLFLGTAVCSSQGRDDSLRAALEHATTDSQRARCLYALGVRAQEDKRDYSTALAHYRQALALDAAAHSYRRMLTDYATVLNIYFYLGDYPAAMKAATEELALAEERRDSLQMAKSYNTIGFIYSRQSNIHESGAYYALCLDLSAKAKDSLLMADAYSSIGELKAEGNHFGEALASLFKAYDLYAYLRATERVVHTAYRISQVYKGMQNYREALIFSEKTLKDIETAPWYNEYDRALYYINAGDIYKGLGDFPRAVNMTRRGLAIALRIRHREDVQDAWCSLADIYARQHRYDSAFFYYKLYAALKDSIINDRSRQEIAEIHERYAADRKDKEIALQKELLARQRLWKNILLVSFVFLVAFILLLYNRRRLKQRADYEVKLSRQRNDLFGAVIMAQENERKRIAQDIHDTLGSLLSAAKLNLSALDEGFLRSDQVPRYRTSLKLLDEVSAELRNVAHNIMPAGLSKIGLPAAMKGLLDSLANPSGLKVSYSFYGFEERLPEEVEISVYRILLELVNNVIKHAGASLLTVQMIKYPAYINIIVEDDGVGLGAAQGSGPGKGMGLGNIRSRVGYLKGTMEIDSKEGTGTTVLIEIPC